MKFAASATLLLAAALSTLSAAQTTFISQASIKPMMVKPGGLVTVSLEVVFTEDFRRRLEEDEEPFYIGVSSAKSPPSLPITNSFSALPSVLLQCYAPELGSELSSLTFNKNGTKNMDKRNKTDNAKPDKAAKPGGKLDLLFVDGDIILRSASIKPNNFRPKVRMREEGRV